MQALESLLPVYVAFLAHTIILDEDVQSTADQASDTAQVEHAVLDHAQTILRDLWKENGKDFEAEVNDLEEIKQISTRNAQIVKEMYVAFLLPSSTPPPFFFLRQVSFKPASFWRVLSKRSDISNPVT